MSGAGAHGEDSTLYSQTKRNAVQYSKDTNNRTYPNEHIGEKNCTTFSSFDTILNRVSH